MGMKSIDYEQLISVGCGIDVHKNVIVATVTLNQLIKTSIMKTIFLCLFLSLSATMSAQEKISWTPQQKKAKAEYMKL